MREEMSIGAFERGLFQDQENNLHFKALMEFFFESIQDDICIMDGKGIVVKVSETWQKKHGIYEKDVLGKSAEELESAGIFKPSATLAVLKEKRKIEMVQYNKKGEQILVTGVPIFNSSGEIIWVVSYSSWSIAGKLELERKYKILEDLLSAYSAEIEVLRENSLRTPDIISLSPQMKFLMEDIEKVAPLNISVLLNGETGVGKNLIAKRIHQLSPRKDKPFIEINCGAIPESLMESELFGYEKGAFTGARNTGKCGLIELANEGTLFLDEIAELPLKLQVKLLKALQDKSITRVGGTEEIKVDFRLLSATNKDLKRKINEGEFRSDLYFRISVVPITIPPLRERKEDLVALVEHLLYKLNKKHGYEKRLSREVYEVIYHYPWPGNVRELENVLEHMLVISPTDYLGLTYVPSEMFIQSSFHVQSSIDLKEALELYEAKIIRDAFYRFHTTQHVAKSLGISQPSASRKIKKYIKEEDYAIMNKLKSRKIENGNDFIQK